MRPRGQLGRLEATSALEGRGLPKTSEAAGLPQAPALIVSGTPWSVLRTFRHQARCVCLDFNASSPRSCLPSWPSFARSPALPSDRYPCLCRKDILTPVVWLISSCGTTSVRQRQKCRTCPSLLQLLQETGNRHRYLLLQLQGKHRHFLTLGWGGIQEGPLRPKEQVTSFYKHRHSCCQWPATKWWSPDCAPNQEPWHCLAAPNPRTSRPRLPLPRSL